MKTTKSIVTLAALASMFFLQAQLKVQTNGAVTIGNPSSATIQSASPVLNIPASVIKIGTTSTQ
jgi:hypothetical protein